MIHAIKQKAAAADSTNTMMLMMNPAVMTDYQQSTQTKQTNKQQVLRGCQTNDKVDQLLWAWFSCPTKSADKIGEL